MVESSSESFSDSFGENFRMTLDGNQLEIGLQRLGIRELEERLEVSPLVFGGQGAEGFEPGNGLFHCGSYKEDLDVPMDDITPPIWTR